MLVYHREPMARTKIDGYNIYGKYYNYGRFGPTLIPRKLYLKHQERLVECPIDKEWLDKTFGGCFPDVTFTYLTLAELPWPTIVEIAGLVGIKWFGSKNKKPSHEKTQSLLRSIHRAIENGEPL